ncbi:glycosyltransferase family 4 protein [Arthrobacter methylotrophus]|uniref:Glycosyltransferase family 4 protein n=1 Tax=Arthrobacter methylotrophus TaxID=121291 RepID=A0ABV5USR7_9MICC
MNAQVRRWVPRLGFTSAFSFDAMKSLVRAIRNVDTVHVSYSREILPILAAVSALMLRKRLIVQPHGMLTSRSSLLHRIADIVVKRLFRASDVVLALTDIERQDLEGWLGKASPISWVVLGNPVGRLRGVQAVVRPAPRKDEALWVARLHPRKRVGDFVSAAAISIGKGAETQYAIVGPDGGQRDDVIQACRAHPNLVYEGAISPDDVVRRIDASGVFVLTSHKEPWGNVLATALSLGVPVVVTESCALSATISKYGAGLVVPDGAPASMESSIAHLLGDDIAYSACSEAGLRMSKELLSEEAQKESLALLYREL